MASRIDFGNIVGDSTIDNGGNAGKLLALVMSHLAAAKSNNQLTASEVGAIYAASISNAINVALEFELKRDLSILEYTSSEVGIDKLRADIALTNTQREEAIANGLEARKVQEKEIEKINVDMAYVNVQREEATANGIKAREVKDVEIEKMNIDMAYVNVQREEAIANGIETRKVQEKEIEKMSMDIAYVNVQKDEAIANGSETRKVQEKEIEKMGTDIAYTNTQREEAVLNGVKAREVKDVDMAYTKVQKDEALLNGDDARLTSATTREVKEADKVVKEKQAELLARQKTSLDDNVLKDLFKESVGGYGMIYEALQNKDITVPTLFKSAGTIDGIVSDLRARAT